MPFGIGGLYLNKGIVGATTGKLLDTYPNAAFAYSFRKLRNAYAGSAVRIRRSSDNAEADIGFDAEGDFDTTAAATHIGAGTGYIVTWYDQSGNGLDVTQATANQQPLYSATGLNSLPSAYWDGAITGLSRTFDMTSYVSTNCTIFAVQTEVGTDTQSSIFNWNGGGASNRFLIHNPYDGVLYFDFGNATDSSGQGRVSVASPGGWGDNPHIVECYRDSGDTQAIVVDGTSLVTGTRSIDLTSASAALALGTAVGGAIMTGYISELVAWGTDLGATNRAAARTAINSYYSVF